MFAWRHRSRAGVVALALSAASSCSSEEPRRSPGDQVTAEPFPTTLELRAEDLASLERADDDGVLELAATPTALREVGVGNVLVAPPSAAAPGGLLRVVLGVERSGERLALRTAHAPLPLAYREVHVRFARTTPIVVPAALTHAQTGAFEAQRPFELVLFDADGDEATENDRIAAEGTIGGGFDYTLALDVDWGDIDALPDVVLGCIEGLAELVTGELPSCSIDDLLPEAKTTFVVHPRVDADLTVSGAAILEYEKKLELASQTLTPVIVGPLVFVPTVNVIAHLRGGASGSFSAGVEGSAVFETSVTLSSKQTSAPQFAPPTLVDSDFGAKDTRVTLSARAEAGVGARLDLLLFDVTGPWASAVAYGKLEADVASAPCWTSSAGVEAALGVKVTTPSLELVGRVTLADWSSPPIRPFEIELAQGTCTPPADAGTLPPGSGPDAERLAEPTYVPWSRTFSSPVEGAHAASPGNSVLFSELARTIDGHYVRTGYGVSDLVKLADDGGLVWSRDLRLGAAKLAPLRARATRDGALLVASAAVTPTVVLTTLAQDGSVVAARGLDVSLARCNSAIAALTQDAADGHYVAGSCVGAPEAFVAHARRDDASVWWLRLGVDADATLKIAERVGDDLFVAGVLSDGVDSMFAARLSAAGEVSWAKRYRGCASAADLIPSAAVVGAEGHVTLAGSSSAQHAGALVRLLPDGGVGFATFPGFGFGAGSVFLLDSLAELPTTGYVAGASSVRFTDAAPENVASAGLVGFDAAGRVRWSRRYTLGAPDAYVASGHVAVRVADDGGVLATALAADPDEPLGGALWAWKPFARDGGIDFAASRAAVTSLGAVDLECSLSAEELAATVVIEELATQSLAVSSSAVDVSIVSQSD